MDEVELGDYSAYKLFPLSKYFYIYFLKLLREKRSQVKLIRQRTERKIKFVDEKGKSLDQVKHYC